MHRFSNTVLKILGGLFGVLLLSFTALESYSLIFAVTASVLISIIGVTLFEGGFLYWAAMFKTSAEGLAQMAISLLASLTDLALIIAAVALRLGAIPADIDPMLPARIITIGVIANLVAKYTYSLATPEVMKNIYGRAAEGFLMLRTFKSFDQKSGEIADQIADRMGDDWADEMANALINKHRRFHSNEDAGNIDQLFADVRSWLNRRGPAQLNGQQPERVEATSASPAPTIDDTDNSTT